MEAVKEIMDEQNANVERTNDQVRQVIGQVDDSIAAIDRIAQQSKKLNETRITITDTVQNLTAVAEENAAGTQESAAQRLQAQSAPDYGSIPAPVFYTAAPCRQNTVLSLWVCHPLLA